MNKRWIKIKYWLNNFPIRLNLILLLAVVAFVYFGLLTPPQEDADASTDSFLPLVVLLAKVGLIAFLSLVVFSVISTLISYIIYRNRRNNKTAGFALNIQNDAEQNNAIKIRPTLQRSLRPLLGYISGRLILKDKNLSKAFVLGSTQFRKNSLRAEALYGSDFLHFADIQEYQVEGTLLYFEDMLRLIRLPIRETLATSFYNPPVHRPSTEPGVQPQSTRELDVRIEQLRNVEGEMLNYKQFEFGDDVRRIVWKIYGKNRELIVRNAEMRNPYASRIEMYASFHQGLRTILPDTLISKTLLNTYKNAVWTLYQSLNERQEWELKYIPEQHIATTIEHVDERTAYQIAQSQWQDNNGIEHYFDLKNGSVFCIHSLTDAAALEHFLDNGGADKFIYMAYLSDAFKQQRSNWLKKIFFFEEKGDDESTVQTAWLISPLKNQILKNEALLSRILKAYGF